MIPEAAALLEVYLDFYRPERPCGCTEDHPYPHNIDGDGKPAVCLAHEWDRQHRLFQEMLTSQGLSLSIPSSVSWDEEADKWLAEAGDRITVNPITSPSRIIAYQSKGDSGRVAASLAWYLSQPEWANDDIASRQHIVVYLDRSTIITSTFNYKEPEMRDIITWAPILVYWNNHDNRNGSWIKNTIRSRPHGLAFFIA